MYDGPVKRDLLNYAFAMLHLSIRGVDSNIVGCNRSFESPANYPQQLYLTEWFSSTGLPALERRACAEPSLRNLLSGIFTRERLFMPRHDAIGGGSQPYCTWDLPAPPLVVVAIQLSPDWATFSQVGSLWRSTRTVFSQSGFPSRANWCRRCSLKSRDWWRIQGISVKMD